MKPVFRTISSPVVLREEADSDGRTLTGIAAPYNVRSEVEPGVWEMFTKGCFDTTRVVLRDKHIDKNGNQIGRISCEDTDDGLKITVRIANTTAGNDALELVRDGVLDGLSVGYYEDPKGIKLDQDNTRIVTRARMFEVALTSEPAYLDTNVALREAPQQEEEMAESNTELAQEVVQLREAIEDQDRQLRAFKAEKTSTPVIPGAKYRSAGEWLKAVATRETREEALEVTRAFAGTTIGDASVGAPTWLSNQIRLVSENSKALEAFSTGPLPATGMVLEYLTLGGSTIQVQEQVAEGDVLAFGKLNLDSESTGIKTYGGYTSMSFQAIQRSPINVIDTSYALLSSQAAKRSNAAFIAALQLPANVANYVDTVAFDSGDGQEAWINAVVDAELALAATGIGMPANAMMMSSDVYRALLTASLGSTGANFALVVINGLSAGSNITSGGTANTANSTATFMGYPVTVDPGLAAGSWYIYNTDAITTFGSRTPTRLGPDQDITNLTSEISVYFMQATAVQFPGQVVKVDVTLS